MPNMRAKNEQSWALYPSLHQDVRRLLLQDIRGGRLGGFLLQRQMHPLVPAVLLRLARRDALDLDPQPEPPHGQFTEPVERMGGREGHAVAVRMRSGKPTAWKVRSNTVNAKVSCVVPSASHVSRYRLAKSVMVSG